MNAFQCLFGEILLRNFQMYVKKFKRSKINDFKNVKVASTTPANARLGLRWAYSVNLREIGLYVAFLAPVYSQ